MLNDSTASKFVTIKWIEVNDLSNGHYSSNKNTRFKGPILRSVLCDYSDVYIVVEGIIGLLAAPANKNDKAEKADALKTNAPFSSCKPKTR